MANSYNTTPIIGNTTGKPTGKIASSRVLRHTIRQTLHIALSMDEDALDSLLVPVNHEVFNQYDLGCDGKRYCADLDPKFLRK